MLCVANKQYKLSAITLNVFMLSIVATNSDLNK
jgi:hypothetical protein